MTAAAIKDSFGRAQTVAPIKDGMAVPPITATPYVWRDPASIPLRPWVYGRWFLRGNIACVVAPGGVGKSTMLAGTALAMASGRALLGKTVWDGPKRVWLWNLEDDLDELSRSIQAAAKHYVVTPAEIEGRLFVDSGMEGSTLCTAVEDDTGFRLLLPVYADLTAELIRRGIDMLVVDPFVSSHEAEENANTKIDKIAKAWGRVAKAANCVIVLVHHTSKAGASEVTALSARGAVALINASRSTLVINRMEPEQAERLGIPAEDRRRYISVADDKANRAPAEKADWYRLASVDLGNGPMDGNAPGDSIGVAEPWKVPDPFDNVNPSHLLQVQRALDEGDYRSDPQAANWAGEAVANVLGIDLDATGSKARIKQLLATWTKEGALKIVQLRDENTRKNKPFVKVGNWLTNTSAPPPKGGAARGGAVERSECATTTLPPVGEGWCAGDAGSHFEVAQNGGAEASVDFSRWERRGAPVGPNDSADDFNDNPAWHDEPWRTK